MYVATASANAAVGMRASEACFMLSRMKKVVKTVVGRPRHVRMVNGLSR